MRWYIPEADVRSAA